ncbi:DUF177 domain-containing protein [Virgibacillus oceani]
MKFSIAQFRKSAHQEAFAFDENVNVSDLTEMNNDIRKIDAVHVTGKCYMQGEQFIFDLRIEGEMILPCARTLRDVTYSMDIQTSEVFTSSPYDVDEENEIHPVEGEVIDLTPFIKEHIILNLPFRVYSEAALDPENTVNQGQGWELITEKEKQDNTIDPRLKKLENLLEKKENDRKEK